MREYVLTAQGEAQLSRYRAFGAVEPDAPDPTPEEVLSYLASALARAVRLRREANELSDAAGRLRLIIEQAEKVGADDLAVEAIAELITTLRQSRETEQVDVLLDRLERIALGQDDRTGATLALPAAAHRYYALGRLRREHGDDPSIRARHLTSAENLYAELATASSGSATAAWRRRQAASIISLASNLRERSEFEQALRHAWDALRLYNELEDPYGRSRCLFMFGFCLRLQGEFDGAWACLERSDKLAHRHSFQRFKADALMQMGEVRRCQGRVDEARELLDEALQRAARMDLIVTQAFAQSGLGAVEYQQQRMKEAKAAFDQADRLFVACHHREGLALNARRRAVVARRAASAGQRGTLKLAGELIRSALGYYRDLNSPAGLAACEIESGRLHILHHGSVSSAVPLLTSRLNDRGQRHLLQLDPWVPRVLHTFAHEVEDSDFIDRTDRLLEVSEQQQADRAPTVEQLAGSGIERGSIPLAESRTREPFVDEMGGEPRRCWEKATLPQAA